MGASKFRQSNGDGLSEVLLKKLSKFNMQHIDNKYNNMINFCVVKQEVLWKKIMFVVNVASNSASKFSHEAVLLPQEKRIALVGVSQKHIILFIQKIKEIQLFQEIARVVESLLRQFVIVRKFLVRQIVILIYSKKEIKKLIRLKGRIYQYANIILVKKSSYQCALPKNSVPINVMRILPGFAMLQEIAIFSEKNKENIVKIILGKDSNGRSNHVGAATGTWPCSAITSPVRNVDQKNVSWSTISTVKVKLAAKITNYRTFKLYVVRAIKNCIWSPRHCELTVSYS